LLDTERTVAALPPNLLTALGTEEEYRQSVDRLQQAAQRLRDANPYLGRKTVRHAPQRAIKKAHQALFETRQAMIDVPLRLSAK
jgi:hypothetical protein